MRLAAAGSNDRGSIVHSTVAQRAQSTTNSENIVLTKEHAAKTGMFGGGVALQCIGSWTQWCKVLLALASAFSCVRHFLVSPETLKDFFFAASLCFCVVFLSCSVLNPRSHRNTDLTRQLIHFTACVTLHEHICVADPRRWTELHKDSICMAWFGLCLSSLCPLTELIIFLPCRSEAPWMFYCSWRTSAWSRPVRPLLLCPLSRKKTNTIVAYGFNSISCIHGCIILTLL